MKRIVLQIIGCFIPVILIVLCILKLNSVFRPTNTDGAFDQVDTFHHLPENSLDVIIYGSSIAYRGIDAPLIEEISGLNTYNYGYHWQQINTTGLFVEDSLLTQTPKVALIETHYASVPLENGKVDGQIYYIRYLNVEDSKKDFLRDCFKNDIDEYIAYYIPFVRFHDNWSTLSQRSFIPLVEGGNNHLATKGSASDSTAVEKVVIPKQDDIEEAEIPEKSVQILEKIVEICHNKRVEVLFFTVPYAGKYEYASAMNKFANEHDCCYLNLFDYVDEMGIDGDTDYCDEVHLNHSGAMKVSSFLGNYLAEHYK